MQRDLIKRFTEISAPPTSLLLGVDDFMKSFDDVMLRGRKDTGFPPYNIYRRDGEYLVEFALAGFEKQDIDVKVESDRNILVISGGGAEKNRDLKEVAEEASRPLQITSDSSSESENKEESSDWLLIHRGIAKRWFTVSIPLPRSAEVASAKMYAGMLQVHIKIPEKNVGVKQISIE
jgi:HSP20 family molecular chaperone IbpA